MDLEYCPYCMAPVKPGEPCGTCMLTAGSYTPAARHLPPGTVLRDRYLVGRVLGEGGFGITYIGRDLVLGLKVAIKEYFPADKATRDAGTSMEVSSYMGNSSSLYLRGKANFLREAQTIARLDRQPNIVSVKDFFEANNTAYIVMEYIDGTTFKELVEQRGGKLPAWELLHLIEPMFNALSAMHKLDLIHRDISPENLMLEQGTVRLLDFGCARESANGDATMTIMLRHGYAPLEQYQSSREGQGAWTDIYALSATIYYCLTGKKPPQAMDRLLEDQLIPPRNLGVDLSERQEKALLKGLSVLPRTRFQSAEEFHTALYLGQEEDVLPSPVEIQREREEEQRSDEEAPQRQAEEAQSDEERPEAEERLEEEKEEESGTTRENKLLAWLKAHKRMAGVGAAAILAVTLITAAVANTLSHGAGDTGSGGVSQSNAAGQQDTAGEPDNADVPDSGTGTSGQTGYVYNWDFGYFKDLMRNDRVSVIVIPGGEGLGIDEPMEITKPIQLEPNAQLHFNEEVTLSSAIYVPEYSNAFNNERLTVTGEGRIEVDGYWGGDGLLRTVDGGSIHVGDTGHADLGTVWLEQAGDLEADNDHVNFDQSRYIVVDEDALFENAAHVSSFEELENAASDRRTDAIVIDGSFELEYWLTVNKPVLISEGTVLTTRLTETGIIFGDTAINRGRVEGEFQLHSAGTNAVYLNYGSSDVGLNTEGGSCILNFGEIRFRWGLTRGTSIVNMSHMSMERDNNGDALSLVDSNLINYGESDLVSGHLRICANGFVNNRGTVLVSADAEIENSVHFWSGGNGKLILEGYMANHFGVVEIDRLDNLDFRGGSLDGGMIMTWKNGSLLESNENIQNAVILAEREPKSSCANIERDGELELMEASGPQTLALRIAGDYVVDGDLTLSHDLIVEGTLEVTGCLTMDGGVLMNRGTVTAAGLELRDRAYLRQEGELLRLTGGMLTLSNSSATIYSEIDLGGGELIVNSAAFFNQGYIGNIGDVHVDEGEHRGSYLCNRGRMELQEGAGIDIGGGVFTSNWLDIGGNVTVGSGGQFIFTNGVRFYNGAAVTVMGGGGTLRVGLNQMQMDGGTSLVNDGFVFLDGWEMRQFNLDGEIVNRNGGHFALSGEPMLNGVFRNEGELEFFWGILHIQGDFNNQGTAFTHNNDAGFQGNWNGRALEHR